MFLQEVKKELIACIQAFFKSKCEGDYRSEESLRLDTSRNVGDFDESVISGPFP